MMLSRPAKAAMFSFCFFLSKAALAASAASPHAARSAHGADIPRLFLSGPVTFLLVLSCAAVAVLIISAFGGLERLIALVGAGARRIEGGKTLCVLWGAAVGLILFALSAFFFATKILAALGVIVLLIAFALIGAGLAACAVASGRTILGAAGSLEIDDLACLRIGMWVLLFASCLPFLGWLVVLLAAAGGLGGVTQEALARRE